MNRNRTVGRLEREKEANGSGATTWELRPGSSPLLHWASNHCDDSAGVLGIGVHRPIKTQYDEIRGCAGVFYEHCLRTRTQLLACDDAGPAGPAASTSNGRYGMIEEIWQAAYAIGHLQRQSIKAHSINRRAPTVLKEPQSDVWIFMFLLMSVRSEA